MKTVIIFGGSGFVGRHIIGRIAKNGYKIIIPYQRNLNGAKLRLLGDTGQIIPIKFINLNQTKILNLIEKADVIINLKTLWDEKKISFKKGILDFNIDLVNHIKKSKKVSKFIFFSGIGVSKSVNSKRSKAIFDTEQYIQQNLINSIIIRPGVIIGGGDEFLKGLIPLFKISFFIPLFGSGLSKFQPVFIDDVSMAINNIIFNKILGNHLFEFAGPNIFTYKDLYKFIAQSIKKTRVLVPIPHSIIRKFIVILEKIPNFPLNREQLKLFENDNIAENTHKNLSDLDVIPQDLNIIIKKIIQNYL